MPWAKAHLLISGVPIHSLTQNTFLGLWSTRLHKDSSSYWCYPVASEDPMLRSHPGSDRRHQGASGATTNRQLNQANLEKENVQFDSFQLRIKPNVVAELDLSL